MAWRIELSETSKRELDKLDRQHSRRIRKFLEKRLAKLEDPRSIGLALRGSRFGELWRYRVGDFRIICRLMDDKFVIIVIRIAPVRTFTARVHCTPIIRQRISAL